MTNTMVIIILAIMAVVAGVVVILSMMQKKEMRNVAAAFQVLGGCIFCWTLSEIAYFSAGDPQVITYLFNLKLPFVAFSIAALLVLVMRFYRLDKYVTLRLKLLLCIIPAVTTILSLTSPLHGLVRVQTTMVEVDPLHILTTVRGVWFWVHAAYSYVLTVVAGVIVVVQHRKLPSGFRAPSFVMILVMVLNIAANILSIAASIPLDITAVGMCISLLFLYAAIATSSHSDLLVIARDEIFNTLPEYVFILNLAREVQDANPSGLRWLAQLGIRPSFPFPFAHIFDVLRNRGAAIRENNDTDEGIDIYYAWDDAGVVYNLNERFVRDKTGRPIGVYSTLVDVTRYRMVIDRLEKTVEIDPLTGLANRRVYEKAKRRFTEERTLPLAVLLGDANGLKRVNDELGHQQGDVLLRVIAGQFRQCCPENGVAARIGGDEFVLFLPGAADEEAARVAECLTGELERHRDHPFVPSVALGWAVRRVVDGEPEDMEALLRRADAEMYNRKENDRREHV